MGSTFHVTVRVGSTPLQSPCDEDLESYANLGKGGGLPLDVREDRSRGCEFVPGESDNDASSSTAQGSSGVSSPALSAHSDTSLVHPATAGSPNELLDANPTFVTPRQAAMMYEGATGSGTESGRSVGGGVGQVSPEQRCSPPGAAAKLRDTAKQVSPPLLPGEKSKAGGDANPRQDGTDDAAKQLVLLVEDNRCAPLGFLFSSPFPILFR